MLTKLLHRLQTINDTLNENNEKLAEAERKERILKQINKKLQKEAKQIKEQISRNELLKINVVDLFNELQNILPQYEGIYEIEKVIYSSANQLDPSWLNICKQIIRDERRNLRVWFQFVSFSSLRTYDFKLTIPIKDITLTNGERLLNHLELKDNKVIIPKEIKDMILLNIDLDDEMMQNLVFNKAVMNCVAKIEQTKQKN